MKYCFYDTETTGLSKNDEVIEFCAMLFDGDLNHHTHLIDFYCFSTVEISEGAFGVHGIDVSTLRRLSGEKYFEEYFSVIRPLLEGDVVFIAHNDKFDRRLINQTLANVNEKPYDFGQKAVDLSAKRGRWHFDTCDYARKHLSVKSHHYGLKDVLESIPGFDYSAFDAEYAVYKSRVEELNPALRFDVANQNFHNARYDVYSLYYLTKCLIPVG